MKMHAAIIAAAAMGVAVPALAGTAYDEAEVLDAEPIHELVRHVTPREECRLERVPVRHERRSATAPIVGAVIGGAIGNAVGHDKRNKQVGAVVGAVLGGSIAADIAREHDRHHGRWARGSERRKICREVEDVSLEREVVGYDVTYRYGGRTHTARMSRDPGDTVRVRVRVSPI